MARWTPAILTALGFVITAAPAQAQQTTQYHLHKEASLINTTYKQLKLTGPDAAQTALQTANLKNNSGNFAVLLANFETQSGVPGRSGTIPSGSTVSFSLLMKTTSLPSSGTLSPKFTVRLNNASGAQLCYRGGGLDPLGLLSALSTTLTWYNVTCTTNGAISMTSTDRFFLEVDIWINGIVGNHNTFGELDVETGADSTVTIPNPAPNITSLSITSGYATQAVTINGSAFGSTQGSSNVKFNGTTASITSWSDTSIGTTVPAGATTGPVVVSVNNTPSNGVSFTLVPHITTLTPATGQFAQAVTIGGTSFGASQGSSTIRFNGVTATATSWGDTSIATSVPSGATTGPVVVTVGGNASNGSTFTVLLPNIASLTPPSAVIGASITIGGTRFGATQGASTVTFNGTPAAPTSWGDTSITAPVPAGATTGPVVVTVGGNASNGLTFTVITTGTLTGTITRASNGTALSGATVQAVLAGVIKATATSAADGTYSIGNLDPGTYDVRVLATGYSSEVRGGTVLSVNATTTVNVAMSQPGSVGGTVTQSDGITPIAGAAVTVYAGAMQKGTASTNGSGGYTISPLHPGTYTVQAANVGYRTKEQSAVINENATTTANLSLDAAGTGPVLYAYDSLGRLIQVTDPSGDSAIYRYDAVGNITSIERPGANGSSGVAISGFTPASGAVGSTVTIYGTGFTASPGQSCVTFNGTTATVTSANATQIVTTVPAGATSGAIAIVSPCGSATSAPATFTVTGVAVPTITGLTSTPVGAGDTFTVNGTNFDVTPANNRLTVNLTNAQQVTAATSTSLQATVPVTPAVATTGRVSLVTAGGGATSTGYLWVAPPGYVAADVESTGSLSVGDNSVAVATANKVALRAFDGSAGHRVAFNVTGVSSGYAYFNLYGPFGALLGSVLAIPNGFLDPITLPSTATYSVVFDPNSTATPTATLTFYDNVPADFASAIAFETPLTVPDGAPGQNARLTFSGTAGHRLSLEQTGPFNCLTATTSILDPNGAPIASTCGGYFLDTTNLLTATGPYTILVDPKDANHASTTLTLHDVPADDSHSTTIGGQGVVVSMNTPGQNGLVTFAGTSQQVVTVHVTGNSSVPPGVARGTLTLKTGGGQLVGQTAWLGAGDFNLTNQTLPSTDNNYQIIVDPYDVYTGTLTVSVTSP
jgi:YD repeat-containing protein